MRLATSSDYQAILNGLPNGISPNNPGIQMILELLADSRVQLQPYSFPLSFLNVAAGVTPAAQSIFIDTSAPFMLISQQYYCAAGAIVAQTPTTAQYPNMTAQMIDLQSNRQWQSAAVPVASIFGSGAQPYFYPQPRMIAANSNLQVTVSNIDTAQAYSLFLTFTGYRIYSAA